MVAICPGGDELIGQNSTFVFKKMPLNMPSVKWCPFYLGLNMSMQLLPLVPIYHCLQQISSAVQRSIVLLNK